MTKKIVKASDLIQTLKNAKLSGSARLFLEQLIQFQEDLSKNANKKRLAIIIDTDEDFGIKNMKQVHGNYEGEAVVNDGESYHDALVRYVDSLDFTVSESSRYKVDYFVGMIKDDYSRAELNLHGSLSKGGNQTIDVYIMEQTKEFEFGQTVIKIDE